MKFAIKNPVFFAGSGKAAEGYIKLSALKMLRHLRFTPQDAAMDRLMRASCNCSLRSACVRLIKRAKVMRVDSDTLDVMFDKEDEKTVKLITYGNGVVYGSNILQVIFHG